VRVHGEAPRPQLLQNLPLRAERRALAVADAVCPEAQATARRDARIELAQAARRRVARVRKQRLALLRAFAVDALELVDAQVHLAAHLHKAWGRIEQGLPRLQAQRDLAHRAQVGRDHLAAHPVAARRAHRQDAVLVGQRDRQPVDFQLAGVFNRGLGGEIQKSLDALVEGDEFLLAEGVVEAQHCLAVRMFGERAQWGRAYPLRRRIGRDEFGELRLQLLQLAEQGVVLLVADFGLIQHIVAVVVVLYLPA
jgi:tRNA threonylcarbamoyladenosine modification (KEOPS) complex  Pcc1 subunit